jgi:hypothetical protein
VAYELAVAGRKLRIQSVSLKQRPQAAVGGDSLKSAQK